MLRRVNTTYIKEVRINTFDLPNGIYLLRLTSGKQVISRKIIVQH
ncbi:MAG: T9SS type A sorting domain-containing protein [Chlorobi bacterium]|nr:T9SS type A sorting domain-containing protein [Chlorobiota bacterium]